MSTVGTIGITCPRITNPINGQVDQPAGLPEYGSQATFTCNSGHRYSNIFYKVQPKSTLKNAHFLFYFAIRFVPVYLHVPPTPILVSLYPPHAPMLSLVSPANLYSAFTSASHSGTSSCSPFASPSFTVHLFLCHMYPILHPLYLFPIWFVEGLS